MFFLFVLSLLAHTCENLYPSVDSKALFFINLSPMTPTHYTISLSFVPLIGKESISPRFLVMQTLGFLSASQQATSSLKVKNCNTFVSVS